MKNYCGPKKFVIKYDRFNEACRLHDIFYKDGDTYNNCDIDTWHNYKGSFVSAGYVKIRLESPS